MKECPHFHCREPELFRRDHHTGTCRYYLGGSTCSRRDVFLCETWGQRTPEMAARPHRMEPRP